MSGSMPPTPARMQPTIGTLRRRATTASTSPSRSPARTARRPTQAALHRHRDRDRRGRGAGAQCRAQRGDQILRRGGRAPAEGRSRRAIAAARDRAVGMQARRQLRAGQALRVADLAKPDLVQRDQSVTLIYETAGLYLTMRGKALEQRHRRRRRQRDESAIQAHGVRHRDRPRPGFDYGRRRPAAPPPRDTTSRSALPSRAAPVAVANVSLARRSKSRVMLMSVLPYQPHHPHRRPAGDRQPSRAVAPRSTGSPQIGEKPKLTEIENPTTQPGYKPVQMPMPKPETGVLQRELAVAERLPRLLQGSARRARSATS